MIKDICGVVYGDLIVIKKSHQNKESRWIWECLCKCGNVKLYSKNILDYGRNHCGCKANHAPRLTHGLTGTREYRRWSGIKNRCYNKKSKDYSSYGGRGIVMSTEWKLSFERFLKDMGTPPSTKHQMERIDSNKGYNKDNCKWATIQENSENKRTSKIWYIKGKVFNSAISAAKHYGKSEITIRRWCDGGNRTIKKLDCNWKRRYKR